MSSIDIESIFPVPVSSLYRWHTRPGAFGRLLPPWQRAEVEESPDSIEEGARLSFRVGKGPLTLRWVAEHRDVRPDEGFSDIQVQGPFKEWVHRHEFRSHGGGSSVLHDHVDYTVPGGVVGNLLARPAIERDVQRMFDYRHRVLAEDLKQNEGFAGRPRLRVAITGSSGLVGTALADVLSTSGHEVVRLVRSGDQGIGWSPELGILEPGRLGRVDAVVHLAGENIAGSRWTRKQKERIRESRVQGTRSLVQSLSLLPEPPTTFVSASAIGYYGDRGDETMTENEAPGEGFLAEVCRSWESEARAAREFGCRVVLARLGVVLTPRGGALEKMLPPFRLGVGGKVGSGQQVLSWVGIDDVAGALHHLLMEESLEGPFNITAPRPETNEEFSSTLGKVLRRPTFLPMPAAMARVAFGEMADEMLLASTRTQPMRLEDSGYVFRHPSLEPALRHVLGR